MHAIAPADKQLSPLPAFFAASKVQNFIFDQCISIHDDHKSVMDLCHFNPTLRVLLKMIVNSFTGLFVCVIL